MEREKWIEAILNSTDGIAKVTPNDDLFSRIENKIEDTVMVKTPIKWLVAASIAILISINISYFINESKTTNTDNLSELINSKSNQLY